MANEENRVLWPGWETVRLIGRGSFGAVYEIRRDMLGETERAALKRITIPENPSEVEMLMDEGYDDASIASTYREHLKSIVGEYSLMRKLNGCSNVVNCDDVRYEQQPDGIGWDIYIKMELLTSLPKALGREVPDSQVIRIGTDLCRALILCSKHNIIHRDIKPANIFVSENGDYKLGDFGIAKTVEKTSGGTKIGTYEYMAPEVYRDLPYGSGADLYSLGMVLYWLLNERRTPFLPLPPATPTAGEKEQARRRRFDREAIPAPAHGSPALQRVVLKAIAYDPRDRYRSAEEMLRDLEAAAEGENRKKEAKPDVKADAVDASPTAARVSAPEEEKAQPSPSRGKPRKKPWLPILLGLAAVLTVGMAILLLPHGAEQARPAPSPIQAIATIPPFPHGTEEPTPEPTTEPTPEAAEEPVEEDGGNNENPPSRAPVIRVAASSTPHAEILSAAREELAKQGYELEIVECEDYVLPNLLVDSGEVDANYFQHSPYLKSFNAENGTDIVSVALIHYEPFGIYAGKTAAIADLADGAEIIIPNDGSNETRALLLLQQEGLIKLADGIDASSNATVLDIAENPKNLKITEMDAAQLARAREDVDLAVINGNFALAAGLNASADALAIEDASGDAAQTYANLLGVKAGHENDPAIQALVKALQSDAVRDFISNTYNGVFAPSF